MLWGTASETAGQLAGPGNGGKAVSRIYLGISAALVFGVPLGTVVADMLGWRGSFVVYISRTWLLERLKQSIAHEYAVKLEEWMSSPDEQKTLNKLTFEAYLWLPADILQLLTKTLAHEPTAPNAREILASVRQHLLDDSSLKATDIVIIKEENERKAFQAKLQEMRKSRPSRQLMRWAQRGIEVETNPSLAPTIRFDAHVISTTA